MKKSLLGYEDDKQELELALMNAQIEKLNVEKEKLQAEAERFRQEMKWEPWKAFAVIVGGFLGGTAAMAGVILAVAHYLPPSAPPIIINMPPAAVAPK